MMIRGCVRSKVQLRPINETKCLPETDALTANKDEINLFSSFFFPLVVLIEVPDTGKQFKPYFDFGDQNPIKFLKWSTAISFFAIIVLIFVHWRKGPKWWTKIAPILFYSLAWLLFIVLPLSNICVAISYLVRKSNQAKAIESYDKILKEIILLLFQYCLFYSLVAVCRIIEFFVLIRPAMSNMMKTYYDNKHVLEGDD